MDNAFWNEKWEKNEIGFHLQTIHPLLTRYLPECQLKKGNRIFVPLCGKTLDIGYLLEQGFEVVAIELNQSAVEALFRELAMVPNINDWQGVDGYQNKKFQQGNLTVYVGDFFNLLPDHVGHIDLVYDRASIVAFKTHQRRDYVKQLDTLAPNANHLLITLHYDQSQMQGPPFSVPNDEVAELYARFDIRLLQEKDIIAHEPRFAARGLTQFFECISLMTRR